MQKLWHWRLRRQSVVPGLNGGVQSSPEQDNGKLKRTRNWLKKKKGYALKRSAVT